MHCQSPIEGLMAACFAYRNLVHPALKVEIGPSWSDLVGFSAWVEWKTREPDELRIFIGPQIQLEDRRVDFLAHLLFPKGSWFLAIECDGHQYHVANKAQAAKDRRTDRAILIDGIPTMRFTGSEIWEDAMACVDEVIRYFWVRVKDAVMAGMKEREVPC
jgi:very-short-patch-repair endonuclease